MADEPISVFENEVFGYPMGVVEESGHRCVRRTRFPYENMQSAEQAILGGATLEDDGTITRYLPWADPDRRHLRAVRVDWGGLKAAGSANAATSDDTIDLPMFTRQQYAYSVCTIIFADLPFEIGPGVRYSFLTLDDGSELTGILGEPVETETARYCVKTVRPGRDHINPPTGTFNFKDQDGNVVPIDFPLPQILPYEEVEVCLYAWPSSAYPARAIAACLGRVNDATLSLPGGTGFSPPPDSYPGQEIQLYSVRPEPMRFADGSVGFNIHYHMRRRGGSQGGRAINWNSFPNDAGVWTQVVRQNTTDGLYLKADFSKLFVSDQLFT